MWSCHTHRNKYYYTSSLHFTAVTGRLCEFINYEEDVSTQEIPKFHHRNSKPGVCVVSFTVQ